MSGKTYKIYTLGCKVNQYDSNNLGRCLATAGFQVAEKNATVAIINTCAVTKTAIHKCKRMINKAKSENPGARIMITGCWPKTYRGDPEECDCEVIATPGDAAKALVRGAKEGQTGCSMPIEPPEKTRSRYFIGIQDGCEQFCSYCIIPYARGKLKSRPAVEIMEEIGLAVRSGYREIVLSGIHLGLYGRDGHGTRNIKHAVNLAGLLKGIIRIKDLGRVRLSSVEVTEAGDGLPELMAGSEKICKHLHIPLQSGSDKILKLMNRPYDTAYFGNKIEQVRKLMPDIAVTTDVIVGFPGETAQDFENTRKFIHTMRFSRLHVFPYSEHERTPAAGLPGKISRNEIERRAKDLRMLGQTLENEYRQRFENTELTVVVERKAGSKYLGKTEYYFDIEFGIDHKLKIGRIIKIKYN